MGKPIRERRSTGFGAAACAALRLATGTLLLATGSSAAVRPVLLPAPLATGSVQSGAGSAVVLDPGNLELPLNLFAPYLAVYGQRAVLRWRASYDAVLSVDYGETPALGLHAAEAPESGVRGFGIGLRGEQPPRVHAASLDGLHTGRDYYYRATLSEGGVIVADTGVLPFETPLPFVRVRPSEIAMAKDGDHDIEVSVNHHEIYDNNNKGEVYLEWSARVRPAAGDWPWGAKVKGCYPGGAAIDLLFPQRGQPDAGGQDSPDHPADDTTFDPTNGAQTPTLHGDPQAWAPVDGCVAYRYDTPIRVDEAKIGSGEEVELDPDGYPPMEWELPADLPGAPALQPAMLPVDVDGDGEPDGGPSGPATNNPPPPVCGAAPPGSFALVRLAVRGQEFDQVPSPQGLTRIINHDASNTDTLCLDLREEEQTVLMGVKAEDGSLEFTTWFEVTLDYRTRAEAAEEAEPVGVIGTPIVREPIEPVALRAAERSAAGRRRAGRGRGGSALREPPRQGEAPRDQAGRSEGRLHAQRRHRLPAVRRVRDRRHRAERRRLRSRSTARSRSRWASARRSSWCSRSPTARSRRRRRSSCGCCPTTATRRGPRRWSPSS